MFCFRFGLQWLKLRTYCFPPLPPCSDSPVMRLLQWSICVAVNWFFNTVFFSRSFVQLYSFYPSDVTHSAKYRCRNFHRRLRIAFHGVSVPPLRAGNLASPKPATVPPRGENSARQCRLRRMVVLRDVLLRRGVGTPFSPHYTPDFG